MTDEEEQQLATWAPSIEWSLRYLHLQDSSFADDYRQVGRLAILHACREWDPGRGSSLKSFVINGILMEMRRERFRCEGRTHRRGIVRHPGPLPTDDDGEIIEMPDIHAPDPEQHARFRELVARLFDGASERERAIVALLASGETQSEVARDLGVTRKRVRQILRRIVKRSGLTSVAFDVIQETLVRKAARRSGTKSGNQRKRT